MAAVLLRRCACACSWTTWTPAYWGAHAGAAGGSGQQRHCDREGRGHGEPAARPDFNILQGLTRQMEGALSVMLPAAERPARLLQPGTAAVIDLAQTGVRPDQRLCAMHPR